MEKILRVVASESGVAQTICYGVWGCRTCESCGNWKPKELGSSAEEGESPVGVRERSGEYPE